MARQRFPGKTWLRLSIICLVAGIIYSSWPLGDWLNPAVNAGLASDLEATGQPFNWLFIMLDVVCGLVICAATVWLLSLTWRRKSRWLRAGLLGFGVFGLLTAIDAVLPLDCVSVLQVCGPIIDDPLIILHGIASIGSIAGLTLSIASVWWLLARDRHSVLGLRLFLHSTVLVWAAFGLLTLSLMLSSRSSALSQHVFITICSIWIAVVPYLTWRVLAISPFIVRKEI